jgi:hypothetical protein
MFMREIFAKNHTSNAALSPTSRSRDAVPVYTVWHLCPTTRSPLSLGYKSRLPVEGVDLEKISGASLTGSHYVKLKIEYFFVKIIKDLRKLSGVPHSAFLGSTHARMIMNIVHIPLFFCNNRLPPSRKLERLRSW